MARHHLGGARAVAGPLFSSAVVLIIAIAAGANIGVSSVVNALLLRPLPVRGENDLVLLLTAQGSDLFEASAIDVDRWSAEVPRLFQALGVGLVRSYDVTGSEDPERVAGAAVTPSFFSTLGVRPLLGRDWTSRSARRARTGR